MLAGFCFISNFLELLLGNTFRCHLLNSQRNWLERGPNCTLLSGGFLVKQVALFPGNFEENKRAEES